MSAYLSTLCFYLIALMTMKSGINSAAVDEIKTSGDMRKFDDIQKQISDLSTAIKQDVYAINSLVEELTDLKIKIQRGSLYLKSVLLDKLGNSTALLDYLHLPCYIDQNKTTEEENDFSFLIVQAEAFSDGIKCMNTESARKVASSLGDMADILLRIVQAQNNETECLKKNNRYEIIHCLSSIAYKLRTEFFSSKQLISIKKLAVKEYLEYPPNPKIAVDCYNRILPSYKTALEAYFKKMCQPLSEKKILVQE